MDRRLFLQAVAAGALGAALPVAKAEIGPIGLLGKPGAIGDRGADGPPLDVIEGRLYLGTRHMHGVFHSDYTDAPWLLRFASLNAFWAASDLWSAKCRELYLPPDKTLTDVELPWLLNDLAIYDIPEPVLSRLRLDWFDTLAAYDMLPGRYAALAMLPVEPPIICKFVMPRSAYWCSKDAKWQLTGRVLHGDASQAVRDAEGAGDAALPVFEVHMVELRGRHDQAP